ncbi:hypothetical protein RDWZM_007702 [Blomia tropicalis]|uniref:ABC transporter domain-containing protein n=1 Tax=Blomia tropicalis TaxID=40697 RepID=A0A9Q0M349_BLOTA|nr:hypothetical protein RDWZM_007702 [Blomia tropicalis]
MSAPSPSGTNVSGSAPYSNNQVAITTNYISGSSAVSGSRHSNASEHMQSSKDGNDVDIRWGSKVFLRCEQMTDFEIDDNVGSSHATTTTSAAITTTYESGSSTLPASSSARGSSSSVPMTSSGKGSSSSVPMSSSAKGSSSSVSTSSSARGSSSSVPMTSSGKGSSSSASMSSSARGSSSSAPMSSSARGSSSKSHSSATSSSKSSSAASRTSGSMATSISNSLSKDSAVSGSSHHSSSKEKLTIVVGSIGSGKSTFLASLIGETYLVEGELHWLEENQNGYGYVPSIPWILNVSLQENITFGRSYERKRYVEVVKACCLQADIDLLPCGDQTIIGERGINLSGGQKQRIALARAIYSNTSTLILDDCISALDPIVGYSVFDNAIMRLVIKS